MIRTQLCLTEAQKRALEAISAQEGVSIAQVVRRAVDTYLAERSPTARAEQIRASAGAWAGRPEVTEEGLGYVQRLRGEWEARGQR